MLGGDGNVRTTTGAEIVAALGRQLEARYGRGFGEKNLRRMVQFAEVFPDAEIVVSLIRQLSWTHFIALIPLKAALQREFYAEMCRVERWSVRTLRQKIDNMLYERTALSKKPELVIQQELETLREKDDVTPALVSGWAPGVTMTRSRAVQRRRCRSRGAGPQRRKCRRRSDDLHAAVRVEWPSGAVSSVFAVALDREVTLVESDP